MLSDHLKHKIDQSRLVLEEAFESFSHDKIVIAWSGGKDSTLLLWLTIEFCRKHNLKIPRVLDIDQGDAFDEILEFRNRLVKQWGLDLVIVRNEDVLDKVENAGDIIAIDKLNVQNQSALREYGYSQTELPWLPASPACNHLMKSVPISNFVEQELIQALITGIRWDEHPARANESYFSVRDKPQHIRVHPLLHLTEHDIWEATFALKVPFNVLYMKGYRSLDTKSGSQPTGSKPAWEQAADHSGERNGRCSDKESIMQQLRALGYM